MTHAAVDMDTIARQLGVSKSTVSRALNGHGRIGNATRQKVLEAAHALGYRPNLLASSLRSQRTATLGVVVPGLTSPFFAHVLEGIESAAQDAGYSIILSCSYGEPQKERELLELLLQKAVDGLLAFPAHPSENAEYFRQRLAEHMPLVFVDRYPPAVTADVVTTNNRRGGELAAEHLLRAGRRRILFLATAEKERDATCMRERLEGCNQALIAAGADPAEIIGPEAGDTAPEEHFGYLALQRYLNGRECPDGIFAANDSLAFGAIRALAEAGLRVPEDIAVIGYDDKDVSAFFRPALTTIRQPMRQMGERAVELLLRRLQQGESLSYEQIYLTPELIIRQSCGAAIKQ
ncbi:MAG TPA: LacI family DNA-binding transcriptional regulator [Armatimonadota bacterium]|nr:LacI family DNA-binding transcriptional regulator [Armatimonadota bacterium]